MSFDAWLCILVKWNKLNNVNVDADDLFTMPGLTCDHASFNLTSLKEGTLSVKLQHLQLHVQTAHPQ